MYVPGMCYHQRQRPQALPSAPALLMAMGFDAPRVAGDVSLPLRASGLAGISAPRCKKAFREQAKSQIGGTAAADFPTAQLLTVLPSWRIL